MTARPRMFGVPVDPLTMEGTVSRCLELIEGGRPAQHVVLNAAKVVLMEDEPGIREKIAACDHVGIDGQSVVWAGRLLGIRVPERVAGIDLMLRLLAEAEARAIPVYFLGATPEVIARFVARVREMHPDLVIRGYRDGYFDDDEAVADAIAASGARLVLVGMSSPRKEHFISATLSRMGPVLAMGVGGSFDVVAGVTRRAPRWMQRSGLEWFHRFASEPRRMWRRYLVGNARFLWLALRELLKRDRPGITDAGDV